MEVTAVYQILLTVAGSIILILLGIIVQNGSSLFKTVKELSIVMREIQAVLTERNTACSNRHVVIDKRLDEHGKRLDEHDIKFAELQTRNRRK